MFEYMAGSLYIFYGSVRTSEPDAYNVKRLTASKEFQIAGSMNQPRFWPAVS